MIYWAWIVVALGVGLLMGRWLQWRTERTEMVVFLEGWKQGVGAPLLRITTQAGQRVIHETAWDGESVLP